ncbi:hypothetical protein PTSG_04905 [Salpingoeca rosetta]|uniref:PPM-type phosphatase domain-containing protein n=1 Tax=Salpingoeca rosetta (strain ATCC 50818 / BSB-021) TaxID=946362 RepID=F2U8Y8_SALR5|nr:uncharacterized protein PTSG_04905 [Salpingoeca rosetta]EGD73191.1 hypothetical protein PTSG_04905 [Salpingoeca rosetta]|eukprot:XP_004994222.1 hypothetical protein PTSG_04905 [Salpingoeca rosetta]
MEGGHQPPKRNKQSEEGDGAEGEGGGGRLGVSTTSTDSLAGSVDNRPHSSGQQQQREQQGQQERQEQQEQQTQAASSETSASADEEGGKKKKFGYGYGKSTADDANDRQQQHRLSGYTFDAESGWYFNNMDPTWLFNMEQQVHFHTTAQQFFVMAEDGTLTPYVPPETSNPIPQEYRCAVLSVQSGLRSMQGRRPTQEDRHAVLDAVDGLQVHPCALYGVYDGHCGVDASEFCEKHLHEKVFAQLKQLATFDDDHIKSAITTAVEELDADFLRLAKMRKRMDGSCVLIACILGTKLFTAHLGDSRAILCRDNKAVRLTEDHKPEIERERKRIEQAGGRIVKIGRVYRTTLKTKEDKAPQVLLAVARSIGDLQLKQPSPIVSATPDVCVYDLQRYRDAFVVLACDGVWDVLSDDDVMSLVLDRHRQVVQATPDASDPGVLRHPSFDARAAASLIMTTAFDRGSGDNISVIVVALDWKADDEKEKEEKAEEEKKDVPK